MIKVGLDKKIGLGLGLGLVFLVMSCGESSGPLDVRIFLKTEDVTGQIKDVYMGNTNLRLTANQDVTWDSNNDHARIDKTGHVTILNAQYDPSIGVTIGAKSVENGDKTNFVVLRINNFSELLDIVRVGFTFSVPEGPSYSIDAREWISYIPLGSTFAIALKDGENSIGDVSIDSATGKITIDSNRVGEAIYLVTITGGGDYDSTVSVTQELRITITE